MRLSDDAVIVKSVAPATVVDVIAVDLAETERVEAAMEDVRRRLAGTPPECIFYNAACYKLCSVPYSVASHVLACRLQSCTTQCGDQLR
jgi:hypothetical protein